MWRCPLIDFLIHSFPAEEPITDDSKLRSTTKYKGDNENMDDDDDYDDNDEIYMDNTQLWNKDQPGASLSKSGETHVHMGDVVSIRMIHCIFDLGEVEKKMM